MGVLKDGALDHNYLRERKFVPVAVGDCESCGKLIEVWSGKETKEIQKEIGRIQFAKERMLVLVLEMTEGHPGVCHRHTCNPPARSFTHGVFVGDLKRLVKVTYSQGEADEYVNNYPYKGQKIVVQQLKKN